jgi:hypothetical protein
MGKFIQAAANPGLGYDTGFAVAGALSVVASVIGFALINPEASKRRFALLLKRGEPVSPAQVVKPMVPVSDRA